MDDLISRQEAKKELKEKVFRNYTDEFWGVMQVLDELPPAQPERKIYSNMTAEDFEEWLRRNGICHPNVHEDISCSVVPLLIDDAINEVLSAQPEREKGEWIEALVAGMPAIHHEKCGAFVYAPNGKKGFNFCPNCGAKMEGTQ